MIRVPFAPTPGLVTEETEFSVPNACTDADKVRWRNGKPEPIGGWVKYFTTQLAGVCRAILAWTDLTGKTNIAFGTNSNLYVHVNGTVEDITPSGLAVGAIDGALVGSWGAGEWGDGYWGEGSLSSSFLRTWSLGTWGQNLVANPRGGTIYLWENDPGTPAAAISNAPDEVNAILVTPERQVLAIGCSEEVGGAFNPLAVRGCKSEDLTDWTTNTDDNVFEDVLAGGGSRLVTGRMVGEYVAVWTDEGLFMGQFVGTVEQTYQWDLQGTGCGLIGPNAVVVVGKRAYWITTDLQVYTWAPGEAPSPVNCPIGNVLSNYLVTAQQDKIVGCAIGQFGEVWWYYPDSRDGSENSRYISMTTAVPYGQAYHWSKGILARTAVMDAGAINNPLKVSPDGYLYSHEDGQRASGGVLSGYYTISMDTLDEGGRFFMVQGMEPDFKDQMGALTLSLTLRKYPQSTDTTGTKTITIAPGATRKHFMTQGRCGTITISWESSPAFHRLGKPVLLGIPTGRE